MNRESKLVVITCTVIGLAVLLLESYFLSAYFKQYLAFIMYASSVLLAVLIIVGLFRNKILFKTSIIVGFVAVFVFLFLILMYKTGIVEKMQSADGLTDIIEKSGPWAKIFFIFIQFAQVTLVPIPSTITVVAGTALFGVGWNIILSSIGMIIGSMVAFFLGKQFGTRLVVWLIGRNMYDKFMNLLRGREKLMLFAMFLLPVFPDDLLCLVAGVTTYSYTGFFITMLITRPVGVATVSLSTDLIAAIPFTGWYILVWAAIVLVAVLAFILMWKYSVVIQDKMTAYLEKRFDKKHYSFSYDKASVRKRVPSIIAGCRIVADEYVPVYYDRSSKVTVKNAHEISDTDTFKFPDEGVEKVNYKE